MSNSHRKVTFEMSENQELAKHQDFDNEIDILLYQNGAEQSIKMLKLIFN